MVSLRRKLGVREQQNLTFGSGEQIINKDLHFNLDIYVRDYITNFTTHSQLTQFAFCNFLFSVSYLSHKDN